MGVKNISFTVNYGECFGLLGLNGAGKTTIFKAITEEHAPTHGSIYINGLNIIQNFDKVKLMFGYCPQFDAIFPYMTVYENLEFYSRIKGVDPEKLTEIIQAMIESMTLTKYKNKLAGRLSGGNKRKLSVAISMICNPPIVLLDEPSTGMDPEARRFMWAVIHKLTSKSGSNSVIMTTHAMDEAETLCKRMGIMVNGEFVCLGSSNYIKETYGYGYEIDIRIKPFEQEKLNEILNSLGLKRNHKITSLDDVKDILKKINKEHFSKYLQKEGIGRKIYHEVTVNGDINLQALINWTRYVACAMKMIKVVLPHFSEVILAEFIENNFLFKIKKSSDSKSIGFLFTLLEKEKDACEITEYSIQQTSLEQIFNKFAENQGKTEEDIKNAEKVDNNIKIDDNLVKMRINVHNNFALCKFKLGKIYSCYEAATKTLTIDDKNPKALFLHGKSCLMLNFYKPAVDSLRKLKALQPDNHDIDDTLNEAEKKYNNDLEKERNMFKKMFKSSGSK